MRLCDHCLTRVAKNQKECPACGRAIRDDLDAFTPDPSSADLARANLLRLRGDYAAAEAQTMSVLRNEPKNVVAHVMLSELFADQGKLDQAAEWCELAADLEQNNPVHRTKLASLKDRIRLRDLQTTAQQIGLPHSRPRVSLYAMLALASVAVVAVAAFMLGRLPVFRTETDRRIVSRPIAVPSEARHPTRVVPEAQTPTMDGGAPIDRSPTVDRETLAALAVELPLGSRLISVIRDPRARGAILTYLADTEEEERSTGVELARGLLEREVQLATVTLRGVRAGRIVYMADVTRLRLEETMTSQWQEANTDDPTAWVRHILTNEWPARTMPQGAEPVPNGSSVEFGGNPAEIPANDNLPITP